MVTHNKHEGTALSRKGLIWAQLATHSTEFSWGGATTTWLDWNGLDLSIWLWPVLFIYRLRTDSSFPLLEFFLSLHSFSVDCNLACSYLFYGEKMSRGEADKVGEGAANYYGTTEANYSNVVKKSKSTGHCCPSVQFKCRCVVIFYFIHSHFLSSCKTLDAATQLKTKLCSELDECDTSSSKPCIAFILAVPETLKWKQVKSLQCTHTEVLIWSGLLKWSLTPSCYGKTHWAFSL